MDLNGVYTLNHSMQTITSGDVTRIVSSEISNTDLMILKGPSAHILKHFDGKNTLSEVKVRLEEDQHIHGSESDFMKVIQFLIENKILLKK